jgi:fatty-acyl-CoA synthase
VAIVYGGLRQTWAQTYERCRRFASALTRHGVSVGDTVAVMLPNVPAMFEAHFAVPMTGAVLNTLNTRLDGEAIAFMLQHGEAKVLLTDREFAPIVEKALALMGERRPLVIEVEDETAPQGKRLGTLDYEALVESGDPEFAWALPGDEWDAIALNYTSGTTGNPKGVVTHHRGAYLNAASNVISWGLPQHAVYMWTLPMFHCNGWCFPWTLALNAGTSVCLRRVDPAQIFPLVREHRVTHLCGAPIVYAMLINAPAELRQGIGTP